MMHLYFLLLFLISPSSGDLPGDKIFNNDRHEGITIDGRLKDYWYNGEAEITSYKLSQARYGELREGSAALVFVTEPFSPQKNTKADNPDKNSISVMKLNVTKKFNTGIYPYSMMNSTFFPVEKGKHSLKVSTSVQEWCGHMYAELRNKSKYEIDWNSYFEGESIRNMKMDKVELEDDIWSKIRLHPDKLPIGKTKMLPSFFYFRFSHTPIKVYEAVSELIQNTDGTNSYSISYPEINRKVVIQFESSFPYGITGWEETQQSGFGPDAKIMTTTATKIKTIKSAYWKQNSNDYEYLRRELGLE